MYYTYYTSLQLSNNNNTVNSPSAMKKKKNWYTTSMTTCIRAYIYSTNMRASDRPSASLHYYVITYGYDLVTIKKSAFSPRTRIYYRYILLLYCALREEKRELVYDATCARVREQMIHWQPVDLWDLQLFIKSHRTLATIAARTDTQLGNLERKGINAHALARTHLAL